MTEMPDFGAFPDGGTFINDGTLMVPVTNICLHLLVLRNMVPIAISPLFISVGFPS